MNTKPSIDTRPAWRDSEVIALIPHMRALARCLVPNPAQADELARDALSTACLRAPSRDRRLDMKLWLLSMVRDTFHEARRARAPGGGPEHELADDLLEALVLVDGARLTVEEAAVICACEAGVLHRRLVSAREALGSTATRRRTSGGRMIPDRALAAIFAFAARSSGREAV